LALYLGKRVGQRIPSREFDPKALAPWMFMNFRVIDERGKILAEGRDLDESRHELRIEVVQAFAKLPPSPFNREDIRRWDFDDLPEKVEVKRHGIALAGYPALVEEGHQVAIRTLDSPQAATIATRAGVRRLFMSQLQPELRRIVRVLPDIASISLHYSIVGKSDDLRADLASAIADRALALAGFPVDLRTRDEFVTLAEKGWSFLGRAQQEISMIVSQSLENCHAIEPKLRGAYGVAIQPSMNDMRQQIARLIFPGFIAATPFDWLQHVPRYVKGVEMRLTKLFNAGLMRDQQQMASVLPFVERYQQQRARNRAEGIVDPALEKFAWMIEELRISVFAQELKTAVPISPQRLEKQWADVKA
jgi:ATP-dependent helicase HrpA